MGEAMKRIIMPIRWILGVFTHQNSFQDNPIIGSPLLNRLGLHVFRLIVARLLYRIRLLLLVPLVSGEDRRFFAKMGYLAKPDFLTPAELDSLRVEVDGLESRIHETI